ncbi:hypothetical protein [Fulvivirga ligni]|uniref:hypothetical protein n=1 Tax=Fulvivirga ligni TaxID=2904246 RepID=UPI001F33D1B9|nr:hypothetical protein [Fulvivirga ligni]UII20125.1 hypothetical protein LVD16_19965 [Fulvivirga ligni]
MRGLFYSALMVLVFGACEVELDNPVSSQGDSIFKIKEGTHSSNRLPESFEGNELSFTATFDSSAVYQTIQSSNQADINKLMGFSDCASHHHENSARFGWRWYNDQLEILAYCYINGQRSYEYITSVNLNSTHEYKLVSVDDKYVFTVDNANEIVIPKVYVCESGSNYMLFPYFGGDEVAPHDITVRIDKD